MDEILNKKYFINRKYDMSICLDAIFYISIYIATIFVVLIPFIDGNVFILDFVSKVNTDHNLELLYKNNASEYGGCLPIIIFISIEIFRKLLIFIILLCSAYSMYNFIDDVILSRTSRLYAGLLYMINPYTYIRIVTGQLFLLFSYAILPFLLKTFIDLLEKKETKKMIKFVVLLSIVAFNIHILIIALIMMIIIFILWLNRHRDLKILKIIITSMILFVLLNSYWIIPTIISKNTVMNNIGEKDFDAYVPKGELFDIAAMYGFWREGYLYAKDFIPGWQILYLIILSLTIIGFISYYKDEKIGYIVVSMTVIGIIGFILASGINGPFGDIIRWLFDNTILKGFRDSHKFVAMMVLAYSALGGLGINKIKNVIENKNV